MLLGATTLVFLGVSAFFIVASMNLDNPHTFAAVWRILATHLQMTSRLPELLLGAYPQVRGAAWTVARCAVPCLPLRRVPCALASDREWGCVRVVLRVWPTGRGPGWPGWPWGQKKVCVPKTGLSFEALFKISFFPRGNFFCFGWFGLGGGGSARWVRGIT